MYSKGRQSSFLKSRFDKFCSKTIIVSVFWPFSRMWWWHFTPISYLLCRLPAAFRGMEPTWNFILPTPVNHLYPLALSPTRRRAITQCTTGSGCLIGHSSLQQTELFVTQLQIYWAHFHNWTLPVLMHKIQNDWRQLYSHLPILTGAIN